MPTNNELLHKAADPLVTTNIGAGGGGLLNAKQSNRFLDWIFDQSVLAQNARVIRMNEPTVDVDKMDLGSRKMKKATEATDDQIGAKPTFTKVSLTTTKLRLDWEMSTESLEDNIEGNSLEDHVAQVMATQTANDLEDVYIHGDTGSGDELLKSFDGWRKLARASANVVDAASANMTRTTFDKALRSLPNKYLQRRAQLMWTTSSALLQDYIWSLTLANGAEGAPSPGSVMGDALVNAGNTGATAGLIKGATPGIRPFGIGLLEVPLYEETESAGSPASADHGVLELTYPNNRLVGIQRDITVYREFQPKKDVIEFTEYVRVAVQIENADAYVHVKNIKVRAI
ncbi:MAG TPA: phage major capsid protein [Alphaproteobacteria bacterium]|nr:phage major capsid protein [Alphaproteobacteria bacterium]